MRRGFLAPSHEDTCAGVERHGVCDGALAAAAEEGRLALLLWLLETRRFGRRQLDEALLAAARHRAGDHRYVDLLLSRGASAAARDAAGDGAAHLCAASRDPAATRTLRSLLHHPSLARDALAVPNAEGRTPGAVAARLEALSQPGGVCLSKSVHDFVSQKVDLNFDDIGEQRVKNTDVWAYDVQMTSAEKREIEKRQLAAPESESRPPTIAVLPFINQSNDPEQDYFADGISEDIISNLSSWKTFPVIARNSSLSLIHI